MKPLWIRVLHGWMRRYRSQASLILHGHRPKRYVFRIYHIERMFSGDVEVWYL